MTSGGPEVRQTARGGYSALQPRLRACSATLTKPSILPPLMSVFASDSLCPPPPFTRLASWYGRSHFLVRGSGTHTVKCPFFAGIPSAPGYVPKNESNDLFSCMITTTCLILWIPSSP